MPQGQNQGSSQQMQHNTFAETIQTTSFKSDSGNYSLKWDNDRNTLVLREGDEIVDTFDINEQQPGG